MRVTSIALFIFAPLARAATHSYHWKNVKIGGGGGFIPNIIFNPTRKGLVYARTDIGGAYRMNPNGSWTPLLDWVDDAHWNYWGCDALATDPVHPHRLYLAVGMYTNFYDPNNGTILISTDYGSTWHKSHLPFKVGGNMPSRGMGERLAVDPHKNNILYFGARSGHGLWRSTNHGATWKNVTNFPSVGTYAPNPDDSTGYESDLTGIAFVTFDSTSGEKGCPTPRIFVGVANAGSDNIFMTEDAGETWRAIPGRNNTYIPHKGVLSPAEKVLYISESNGSGPYDGSSGAVWKYDITTGVWTNITPVSGSALTFGFGGLAVDRRKPGTIMVAALNSWYPDGQIFRSTDSGATWSPLWSWTADSELSKRYTYSDSLAPWLGPDHTITTPGTLQIGWMMEGLNIDPFNSDHWLYGTGATIYGGYDLTKWDTEHNVTIESLADGIEETAVHALISPPMGAHLLSAVADIQGFVHKSLDNPSVSYTNPTWTSTYDLDFAGNNPSYIVRVGVGFNSTILKCALSTDGGVTWVPHAGATGLSGDKVALSAKGDTVLWVTSGGVMVSTNQAAFTAVTGLPSSAIIASDKQDNTIFYAASGSAFYVSTDCGVTFTESATLGASTAPFQISVNPGVTGDVWVSSDKGIFHSTCLQDPFTILPHVTQAWGISFGAPKDPGGYPALFAAAKMDRTVGYYRSDNAGSSWIRINDKEHGFASAAANVISGDPRIHGRVYIGTNGRGIFYGDITRSRGKCHHATWGPRRQLVTGVAAIPGT